uniref:RING-CH-type domain-containing protein n=1 Tax=Alexandrium catenella TaxID=2925 RepID=A0A7S1PRF6_ALECA
MAGVGLGNDRDQPQPSAPASLDSGLAGCLLDAGASARHEASSPHGVGVSLTDRSLSQPIRGTTSLGAAPGDAQCRLCFEGEGGEFGELIAPCECIGTSLWVHRTCLNQWRYHGQTVNNEAMSHCPTCRFQYELYCTFDPEDQDRRKKKRCLRVFRDSFLMFWGMQGVLFLLALLLMEVDHGKYLLSLIRSTVDDTPRVAHPFGELFRHHLFLYWTAAFLLALFLLGLCTAVWMLAAQCFPAHCRRRREVEQRDFRYGRRAARCQDCESCCPWYIDPTLGDGCLPRGDCCHGTCCICEGEAGIVCLLVIAVALVVLGLFVALFLVSLALQRSGQRYLRVLHLKDVAERYAVRDRCAMATGEATEAAAPGQVQMPTSRVSAVTSDTEAIGNISQDEIQQKMREEIRLARGVLPSLQQ